MFSKEPKAERNSFRLRDAMFGLGHPARDNDAPGGQRECGRGAEIE